MAVAPTSVTRGSPLTGRRDAGRGEDAMDAGSGDGQPVLLVKELRQVLLVETRVGRGGQLHHPARQLWVEPVYRTAPTMAGRQSCRARVRIGNLHPLQLAHRQVEQPRGFGIDQSTRLQMVEDDQATLLRRGQGDPASIHGVTESQNSSGVTFSRNYHTDHPFVLTWRPAAVTLSPISHPPGCVHVYLRLMRNGRYWEGALRRGRSLPSYRTLSLDR